MNRFSIRRRTLTAGPTTVVTLQDLADLVEICAEADMLPSTIVTVALDGVVLDSYEISLRSDQHAMGQRRLPRRRSL